MPISCTIANRIAEIVFDVPPVNAFDSGTWLSIPGTVTEAARDPRVHCVLIRAEGRGFCGGVDIKEMQAHPERITLLNRGNYLTFKAVRDAEVPVVTAVHNFVIGGGIGICGASDVVIAADAAAQTEAAVLQRARHRGAGVGEALAAVHSVVREDDGPERVVGMVAPGVGEPVASRSAWASASGSPPRCWPTPRR